MPEPAIVEETSDRMVVEIRPTAGEVRARTVLTAFAGGGLFVVLTLFALLLQVGLGGGEGWVLPIGLGVFFSISFVLLRLGRGGSSGSIVLDREDGRLEFVSKSSPARSLDPVPLTSIRGIEVVAGDALELDRRLVVVEGGDRRIDCFRIMGRGFAPEAIGTIDARLEGVAGRMRRFLGLEEEE